jgi:iron complex transport system substrate-binding protein
MFPGKKGVAMRVRFGFICVLILLAGLFLVSCARGEQGDDKGTQPPSSSDASTAVADGGASGPVTFTDALGKEVVVENPQRVVACMGSFARTWELAGGTLVGASDDAFADYAIESQAEKIGDFSALDMERIIALEPDFVILTAASTGRAGSASQTDLREGLEASGITTAYFEVTTFDDYLDMLEILTEITGRRDLFEANGLAVRQRIDECIVAVPVSGTAAGPRSLVMITYSGGTRVQNASTQVGAVLADLKAVNLADANPSLLSDFSLEAVIELDPDFIFVVPMGNDDAAALAGLEAATAANPAWAELRAVRAGNYIALPRELFLYKPLDKWDDAYRAISEHLYS